jgi:hypothetical protein
MLIADNAINATVFVILDAGQAVGFHQYSQANSGQQIVHHTLLLAALHTSPSVSNVQLNDCVTSQLEVNHLFA